MAREKFQNHRFKRVTLERIAHANEILEEYAKQNLVMTLRQLHYQFVARGLYTNTKQNYDNLGNTMSEGRLAGLVDWDLMEDRLRELERQPRWDSPADIVEACSKQYKEDLWATQVYRPEVWIEKDALGGVIAPICAELRVDYFACRGYVSQSAQYVASKRMLQTIENGQTPIVFHLGDHDPSGLDMTRENEAKFNLLTGHEVEVVRLALNMDQVRKYNPPDNYAKLKDVRAPAYIAKYGNKSWELDALDPPVLAKLIEDAIRPLIHVPRWKKALAAEQKQQNILRKVSLNWDDIVDGLP